VVGFDDSEAAQAALRWAAHHAAITGSELVVVYVSSSIAEWELAAIQVDVDAIRRRFKERLDGEWTAALQGRGLSYRTEFSVGRPAVELMRVARSESASLIVVGMTARGTLGEIVFGSTQHVLQEHAVRPVVAVPPTWEALS
jgi:nucleotide-binding universal stress UspA family protein